ncbi:alpha/beta fold hydrolase [Streptomyces tubercidicus]
MKSNEPGLPIVFVHGMRVSGTMWRPAIQAPGERHPIAAPDLPGPGQRRGEPEECNRLGAFAFRRALPRPQTDAMVAGGLSCETVPGVVAARTPGSTPQGRMR